MYKFVIFDAVKKYNTIADIFIFQSYCLLGRIFKLLKFFKQVLFLFNYFRQFRYVHKLRAEKI